MSSFRIQESFLKLRPHNSLFYRHNSSSSKRSAGRLALYGLTLTSATVIGGTITYANYDSQFKSKVDSYIPGFGTFSERSAVLWHKGVGLAGEGWKNIKKVVLPEKSERVGIQVHSSQQETTPIVPIITTPSKENNLIQPTPTETTPTETTSTIDVPTQETSTETTPTEVIVSTESIDVTKTVTPTETTPSAELNVSTDVPIETTPIDTIPVTTETTTATTSSLDKIPTDTTPTSPSSESTSTTDNVTIIPTPPIETTPTESKSTDFNTTSEKIIPTHDSTATTKDITPATPTNEPTSNNVLQDKFREFKDSSDIVIESINDLVDALNIHALQVIEAIKSPPKDDKEINVVVGSIIGTEEAVDNARKKVEKAKEKQQNLSLQLSDAISVARKEGVDEMIIEKICDKIGNYTEAFGKEERKLQEAERSSQTQIKELENADVSSLVSDQDRALLVTRIALLEKEIETMKVEEERKITDAIVHQQKEQDCLLEDKLASALKEKELEFQEKLENLEVELELEYEEKIKEQLYSQAKAHIAHSKNALNEQAEKLTQELEQKHSEREKEFAEDYQLKLATAFAHLKGIHSVIDTVVETSDSTRRQQSVRVASDALTNIIITANNDPDPYTRHNIGHQVNTLSKVAHNDSFITAMLSSIPNEALTSGISSENGLKTRFDRVKHIASRVALVPEEGGGLGTYLLSFLQSLLTIDMIHTRMIELSKTDPQTLSTFDLLRQAKLSLDHGDLEKAVKCVAQIKGESRRVVQDWLMEAIMYLETRQAVMAITQYLAASNAAVLQ